VSGAAATVEPPLGCGNCRQPMQRLALAGHYDSRVNLDLCRGCDLVWFDGTEAAQLSGAALLELIGAMASARALPHEVLRPDARCPRCDGALALVHNQSRWGHSSQLQCTRRHGAYQSFAQFLQEKGLLRPMSLVDRAKLLRERGAIECVNCGGAIGKDDALCPWCRSVPSLLDVARLAHALDPLDTIEPPAVYNAAARQDALRCAACGAALPPGESISCAQCGATLAITGLAGANAQVQALAPALRAAAAHPAPGVVGRRLGAIDADLPRRREWAESMQAEADAQRGERGGEVDWGALSRFGIGGCAALVVLALWIVWRLWRR
jgi:ribosomal protein S26